MKIRPANDIIGLIFTLFPILVFAIGIVAAGHFGADSSHVGVLTHAGWNIIALMIFAALMLFFFSCAISFF